MTKLQASSENLRIENSLLENSLDDLKTKLDALRKEIFEHKKLFVALNKSSKDLEHMLSLQRQITEKVGLGLDSSTLSDKIAFNTKLASNEMGKGKEIVVFKHASDTSSSSETNQIPNGTQFQKEASRARQEKPSYDKPNWRPSRIQKDHN